MHAHISLKEKIRFNFNKAANTYDQYCHVQNEICQQAIMLLLKHKVHFDCIADFASGTGESTNKLLKSIDYKKCYTIDFAENLLTIAKEKLPNKNIDFICADLEELIFKKPCLDLIFCNMGLQWVEDLSNPITLFYKYLKPKGLLIFSLPIDNNFPEMKSLFKISFCANNSIIKILKDKKFTLVNSMIKTVSVSFKTQYDLLKSLKYLGTNYNKSSNQQQGLRKIKFNEIFVNPKNTELTYVVGIYMARKKTGVN